MKKTIISTLILTALFNIKTKAQSSSFQDAESLKWANTAYARMSLDEKVGQLFMVAAYSGGKNYNEAAIKSLIQQNHIGGIIFMQGSVPAQIQQLNNYQSISKIPLLVAMDAEWGIGMRMKEVRNLPKNIQIGATYDPTLAAEVGKVIAEQCKRMGVNINFGPVVDINNNPDNPVINFRSFGENKENVTKLGQAYARGQESSGVMASAKHFPGHGDTDVDSHKDLPAINKSLNELWNNELYPFRLMTGDVSSVMIAHLTVPALTHSTTLPTTLSYDCITHMLQDSLRFSGLIFTDALNMDGVAKYYKPGEVDFKAFMAGNDVLLFSQSVPKASEMIKAAVRSGQISEARLKSSVIKILAAKHHFGATSYRKISSRGAIEDLNKNVPALYEKIAKASITLCKDQRQLFSAPKSAPANVLYVSLGDNSTSTTTVMNKGIKRISINQNNSNAQLNDYIRQWAKYEKVIIGIHGVHKYPSGNYGLSTSLLSTANYLAANSTNASILVNGNPYALRFFCDAPTLIVNYEETDANLSASLDAVLGIIPFRGHLPVSPCAELPEGTGLVASLNPRQQDSKRIADRVTRPALEREEAVLYKERNTSPSTAEKYDFSRIDHMVQSYIDRQVFPGCQVLIAKDGRIQYNKSFGHHQYDRRMPVQNNHVYDIASVTKIAATTLAVMKLYEEGKINLDATLGTYLPWTRNTNKESLSIRRILLHEAGLVSWIPFYKEVMNEDGTYKFGTMSAKRSPLYSIPVARNLYINKSYPSVMWDEILKSDVGGRRYVYSDLDFLFLQRVVEQLSGMTLDAYVQKTFYDPLRLKNIGYNPAERKWTSLNYVVPTENDTYFRMQLIDGYVHDPGAAMLGGVAGHAGIFSDASSLFVLLQMLLNGGEFSGQRFFKPSTVDLFTTKGSNISRRALGFDRPDSRRPGGPTGSRCSQRTFGHQGFTGTCVWADPETGVVFIFLSNRVYPTAENKLISRLDVRTNLQDEAYKIMGL